MLDESKYKNVRLSPQTHEKLKEIRFYTNQNFIDITTKAVDMYYKDLKVKGKLTKG